MDRGGYVSSETLLTVASVCRLGEDIVKVKQVFRRMKHYREIEELFISV